MESIKQQVEALLEQEPQLLPAAMAERLVYQSLTW